MSGKEKCINVYTGQVLKFLSASILPAISEYLEKEFNVEVSVEKLCEALEITSVVAPSPSVSSKAGVPSNMPSFLKETSNANPPTPSSTGTSRNAGTRSNKTPYSGAKCEYIISRGDRAGNTCGKPVFENLRYCKACKDKKGAGGAGVGSGKTKKPASSSTSSVYKKSGQNSLSGASREENADDITLDEWKNGLFRDGDSNYGFCVKLEEEDGEECYYVIGWIEDDDETIRKLTPAERSIALERGYKIKEEGKKEKSEEKDKKSDDRKRSDRPERSDRKSKDEEKSKSKKPSKLPEPDTLDDDDLETSSI